MGAAQTTAGVIALGVGGGLIYAAITGQSPIEELRKALTSGRLDGAPADRSIRTDPIFDTSAGGIPSPVSDVSASLVPIGQGGHRLAGDAAAAFRLAERNYGRTITVTDSYRSAAVQAAGRRSDPSRFATAENSAHVQGKAVDVNLSALGLSPKGSNPAGWLTDPGYLRLYRAMQLAGWCNYQIRNNTTNGRTPEPWHFSYGGCS